MKAKSVNVQYTINLGQYESVKIGGEWEIEEGETEPAVIKRAFAGLKKMAVVIKALHLEPAQ